MKKGIAAYIQSIYLLSEKALNEMVACFQLMEYPKNYMLLKQGRICNHLWFLEQGVVRYFYRDERGRETNVWFSIDQDMVTDAPSFLNQTPATSGIQLLEDSELYSITFSDLHSLLLAHHEIALWGLRLVASTYMLQIEDRLGDLQFLNAAERYHKLLAQFPGITQRVSLGHIASYLNIAQETLSRIRGMRSI